MAGKVADGSIAQTNVLKWTRPRPGKTALRDGRRALPTLTADPAETHSLQANTRQLYTQPDGTKHQLNQMANGAVCVSSRREPKEFSRKLSHQKVLCAT